jgi:type IV pilus assembly protein PilM
MERDRITMNLKNIIFSNVYRGCPAFGLDISDFSIKIAQLKKKGKDFELISFNRTPLSGGIIKEGEIKKEEKLIEILKKSVKEVEGKSIKTPYAVCSLPEQHAFVKIIQLPKMKLEELKEAVKWEAEANIPLSLDEVYLDWQIIAPVKDHPDHLNILINAAPRELVDKYLQVLRAANIEPVIFEIESISTARSLIKDGFSPKPVLIIDLGFNRTSFIIFAGHSLCFTSSISVSNQKMITNIIKKLGVSQKEAQLLKFKIGLDKEKRRGKIFNALLPSLVDIVSQIKDCMVFYKKSAKEIKDIQSNISKVILCGGGAYLKGLRQYLSSRSKIPVSLGNPWINLFPSKAGRPRPGKIPAIPYKESLAYSTVLGLAFRGIDIKC